MLTISTPPRFPALGRHDNMECGFGTHASLVCCPRGAAYVCHHRLLLGVVGDDYRT
jgi:hypothetical protein